MDVVVTGQKIAKLRKEKGLTQNDLAQALHVSISAVSKWERGLNFPDLTLLEPLALALDTTAAELLGLESAPAGEVIRNLTALTEEEHAKRAYRILLRVFLALGLTVAIVPLGIALTGILEGPEMQTLAKNLLWPLGLGVISWSLAGAGLISGKCWRGLSCLSWGFCALAMYFPAADTAARVNLGDLGGVADVAGALHLGVVVLLTGTMLLNAASWILHGRYSVRKA